MKKLTTIIALLFFAYTFAQEIDYKEYNYTELFKMIAAETDSVFELKDAIIKIDSITDKRFFYEPFSDKKSFKPSKEKIQINNHVVFNNVIFDRFGAIHNVTFNKSLDLLNVGEFTLFHSELKDDFNLLIDKDFKIDLNSKVIGRNTVSNNTFSGNVNVIFNALKSSRFYIDLNFHENTIDIKNKILKSNVVRYANVYFKNQNFNSAFFLINNRFRLGDHIFALSYSDFEQTDAISNRHIFLRNNDFSDSESAQLYFGKLSTLEISNNILPTFINISLNEFSDHYIIKWTDFKNKVINGRTSNNAYYDEKLNKKYESFNTLYKDIYKHHRIENEDVYNGEMLIRGKFIDYYRLIRNTNSANSVYIEMKDIETERLKYLYKENPSFDSFFTFKINQFLKVFSAYGTRPSKAIIFSMYVILLFALIYLFFPNSWDKHGKNRIVNRYNFFFKYMKQKSGIHEVYLEEQKDELMSYNQFKNSITESQQKVPKFFTATALPLYKWAISGTRLSASLLKRVDIMKGTWQELPQPQRIWKSILLVGAFLIAVIYDIFIKMLNALMLSINTFTTLGFGEIPIKGLPRYLAIIQGFIGWFMLTIFSVSLISQLLN